MAAVKKLEKDLDKIDKTATFVSLEKAAKHLGIKIKKDPITELISVINESNNKDKRIVMIHYADGQNKLVVPEYIKPEDTDGQTSPYWLIDGTYRFKDATGEKWESLGPLQILHYTARGVSALSTDQAVAIDQFIDLMTKYTFSPKGFIKELLYILQESGKGTVAEKKALKVIKARTSTRTQVKIEEMLGFIKEHPEIRYMLMKSGAFTYETAVQVIDQLIVCGVTYLSHTISFVEDRTRRRYEEEKPRRRWI